MHMCVHTHTYTHVHTHKEPLQHIPCTLMLQRFGLSRDPTIPLKHLSMSLISCSVVCSMTESDTFLSNVKPGFSVQVSSGGLPSQLQLKTSGDESNNIVSHISQIVSFRTFSRRQDMHELHKHFWILNYMLYSYFSKPGKEVHNGPETLHIRSHSHWFIFPVQWLCTYIHVKHPILWHIIMLFQTGNSQPCASGCCSLKTARQAKTELITLCKQSLHHYISKHQKWKECT